MEQELEFVQIDIFRANCVASQIRTHKNAKAILGDDRVIKNLLLLRFFQRVGLFNLEVFDLLLL